MSEKPTLAEKLYYHSKRWTWNADLMTCRECKRSLHVTRRNEGLVHASGCSNINLRPWNIFIDLTPDPLTSAIERMQAVPVRDLTDMLMDATNYKSGAEAIRARLIEAAKG